MFSQVLAAEQSQASDKQSNGGKHIEAASTSSSNGAGAAGAQQPLNSTGESQLHLPLAGGSAGASTADGTPRDASSIYVSGGSESSAHSFSGGRPGSQYDLLSEYSRGSGRGGGKYKSRNTSRSRGSATPRLPGPSATTAMRGHRRQRQARGSKQLSARGKPPAAPRAAWTARSPQDPSVAQDMEDRLAHILDPMEGVGATVGKWASRRRESGRGSSITLEAAVRQGVNMQTSAMRSLARQGGAAIVPSGQSSGDDDEQWELDSLDDDLADLET